MVENVRRWNFWLALFLAGAVLSLVLPDRPLRLGLDLAGGTRLVYDLNLEQARKDGAIDPTRTDGEVIEETMAIIHQRVNPTGVLEPIIRRVGLTGVEISLPGAADIEGKKARGTLAEPMPATGTPPLRVQTATEEDLANFPGGGGVISIGAERLRYSERVGNEFAISARGQGKTTPVAHAAGEEVSLVNDDQIRNAIENLGDLRFYIESKSSDYAQLGTDDQSERKRLDDWLAKPENAAVSIKVFNSLPRDQGGPAAGIRWFPMIREEGTGEVALKDRHLVALSTPKAEWTFTGEDMKRVDPTRDDTGFPAVSFELHARKRVAFSAFTGSHIGEGMAIVLNDEIVSLARINSELPGSAQIYGKFTEQQVDGLVRVLRSGSLRIKPILLAEERVGATVGQQAVDQGWKMALLALAIVSTFMIAYYRWLGVYAVIGLCYNLILQMAALVALQATLTMPGIAGIILGIGMAVDANILIFTRIMEEQDSGKKPMQAAKAGFEGAMSAIVDGNVTTVLAGTILYWVGTGPIRGFAVTLVIGVLTSMIGALLVCRLMIHYHLRRKPDVRFVTGRWFAGADYKVLQKTPIAVGISIALIVAGLGLFFWLPDARKLGTDFLGGATVKVRTEEPQTIEAVRTLVSAIPGEIGASSEVASLPVSETDDGRFTEFRITFKTPPVEGQESSRSEEGFRGDIERGLGAVLQKGPIAVALEPRPDATHFKGELYFEDAHTTEDVKQRLEAAGLKAATVAAHAGRATVFDVEADGTAGINELGLRNQIRAAFTGLRDDAGRKFAFAEPIPETSIIGSQVVGELVNSAIRALMLSLLVTVIYIRVRFAEYSFGIAAVVALLHDILITVGAVSFLVWIPWIHVEFNMALIAVFLTIVGYSINDTIVVFDRIRENLPRMQGTLEEVVNTSINQTFARTVLTSTSIATIMIVLMFNIGTGSVLEGFAFAMTFGIVTGTFSSIYIASPLYVWFEKWAQKRAALESARSTSTVKSAS